MNNLHRTRRRGSWLPSAAQQPSLVASIPNFASCPLVDPAAAPRRAAHVVLRAVAPLGRLLMADLNATTSCAQAYTPPSSVRSLRAEVRGAHDPHDAAQQEVPGGTLASRHARSRRPRDNAGVLGDHTTEKPSGRSPGQRPSPIELTVACEKSMLKHAGPGSRSARLDSDPGPATVLPLDRPSVTEPRDKSRPPRTRSNKTARASGHSSRSRSGSPRANPKISSPLLMTPAYAVGTLRRAT
jgi:hypothetical protein